MFRKLMADMAYRQAKWSLGFGRLGMAHAYRLLRAACVLWPNHPEACHWMYYLQGRLALERGNPERAVLLLREADRALPGVIAIRTNLGLAYTVAGKHEQAISTLERVLREDPGQAREDIWSSLAWSYLHTGRAPKAREACKRAEELGVRSTRLDLLHRLATGVGIGSLPVSELSALLRTVPQAASMLLEYARLQAQEGRHRLARAAISALPSGEMARSYSIIAHASLNQDDDKTASWAAEQVLRTKDQRYFSEAALLRSEVGVRRSDWADAALQARKGLEADPQSGRLHEQLGRVLLLQGKWDEAVGQMVEALHTGQAGALAAGVAALAAMEVNDLTAARGLFMAERHGDGLACATSHVAHARVLSLEQPQAALRAAQLALDELEQLPDWARSPVVWERLTGVLRRALEKVGQGSAEEGGEEARALLQRLEEIVGRHGPPR